MARIAQTIEINVPAHIAFGRLAQFENYPEFMQDIEEVRRLDDGHLHWSGRMQGRAVEWDAEITERQADRCIAWRNTSGPMQAGRVELQPLGEEKSRVTLTMECEPAQIVGGQSGDAEALLTSRLEHDLVRFKEMIEAGASASGQSRQAMQSGETTQSEASLSRRPGGDADGHGVFSVAEEQNFDEQSDQARRVGNMPEDIDAPGSADPSNAIEKTIAPPPSASRSSEGA
ncbi:MAG TPA: SRPBCC family protein [Noviherbaspirillum sp.]